MQPSDDDLVARVAGGDGDACQRLVERHLGRILGLASRLLGQRADAEDVAQETFLRLWAHAGRWRPGEARLSTWLHRVALNLCRDRHASRRESPVEDTDDRPDIHADVVHLVEQKDLARHVQNEIMQLTESQRVALTLSHYQGLRNTEAAELMGISVDALESLLARARRTLRERLAPLATELLEGTP